MISVFRVSGILCASPQSAVDIKYFFQLDSVFFWNPQWKREKASEQSYIY